MIRGLIRPTGRSKVRTPNKNLDVLTKSFLNMTNSNQFDESDPADIKRKMSKRILHNVLMTYTQELPKVFFARKCLTWWLASMHNGDQPKYTPACQLSTFEEP